jgi:cyclase
MLKKRVIFVLLYDNGIFSYSRNFCLQKVGDLNWLKQNYNFSHISFFIDELIILDVSRGERGSDKFNDHIGALTEECFIPIAAGGGIETASQARDLFKHGADKIVINSLASASTEVINEISMEFGRQSVVISVDAKLEEGKFNSWINSGSTRHTPLLEWLTDISKLPIGELYLNSIDNDGVGNGYHLDLLDSLPESFPVPVILAGGAGKYEHFADALQDDRVNAVATANLFNFIGNGLEKSRNKLLSNGFNLAHWDSDIALKMKNILI